MNRSICIHSNRNLNTVKDNIHSVINYVESSKEIEFVLSDNSQDEEKEKYFKNIQNRNFNYLISPHKELTANAYHCLENSKGKYICNLGDDDKIIKLNNKLDVITDDFVGIRPNFVVFTKENGISNFSNFSIMQNTPVKRIEEYFKKCNHNNNTLYSFFDRSVYLPLISLINTSHPFKHNGYFDWPVVLCFIAEGKIITDPNTVIFYNNERWDSDEKTEQSVNKLFTKNNHNEKLGNYLYMLLALDSYILLSRIGSSLSDKEKLEVASKVMMSYLKIFFKSLSIEKFNAKEMNFLTKLTSSNKIPDILKLMIDLVELSEPGKGNEYYYFYQKATGRLL